jgi:hypothetical protein
MKKNFVDEFLRGISLGFQKSPFELILAIILFFSILAFLIIAYIVLKRINKAKLIKVLEDKFSDLIREFNLTVNEIELINSMSRYLLYPEKKYLLLVNRHTFNYALHKLKEEREIQPSLINSLQEKLKYTTYNPLDAPVSTEYLYADMPVILETKEKKIWGLVKEVDSNKISIKVPDTVELPLKETKVNLIVYDFRGIFVFSTSVQKTNEHMLYLEHSDNRVLIQREKAVTKEIKMDVFIQHEGLGQRPVKSTLLTLGSSYASLSNPEKRFRIKEDVRLFFTKNDSPWFQVNAEVVRLSKGGAVIHVRFGHLKDDLRDEIIGLLKKN